MSGFFFATGRPALVRATIIDGLQTALLGVAFGGESRVLRSEEPIYQNIPKLTNRPHDQCCLMHYATNSIDNNNTYRVTLKNGLLEMEIAVGIS